MVRQKDEEDPFAATVSASSSHPAAPSSVAEAAAAVATGETLPATALDPAAAAAVVPHDEEKHRYRTETLLGRGGMGEVFLARDTRVGRPVAVKRLRVGPEGEAPPENVSRFLREARVQGRLDHPAIVPVHDLGMDERGIPYFVMKRLSGRTLAQILAGRANAEPEVLAAWPLRTLLGRLGDVALAVEFAHTRGVVHRDLKPDNIVLGDFGEVYVLDWGIARIADDDAAAGSTIETGDLDTLNSAIGATRAGAIMGTPGYMSPEQCRGEPVDHRTDIYAVGCMLFDLLAGEPVFPRGIDALASTRAAGPAHPAARQPEAEVAPELDAICARATAPHPAERHASLRELHDAVQRYLDGDRDMVRRRELANEHAERAQLLLSQTTAAARAQAMAEAGRALALDPANAVAAGLVSRILLEPPIETPHEVTVAQAEAGIERGSALYRAGLWAYGTYALFLPALLFIGVKSWPMIAAVGALVVINIGLLYAMSRRRRVLGRWLGLALLVDGLLTATLASFFSPLLVVPGLAAVSCMTFLSHPYVEKAIYPCLAACCALLVPVVLELVGILPRTFVIENDRLSIQSWVIGMKPGATLLVLVCCNVGLSIAAATLVWQQRRTHDEQDRRMHLLAWHLGKLVPEQKSAPRP